MKNNDNICPFNKEICNEEKVLHITDIQNGNCTQMNLCKKCALSYEKNEIHMSCTIKPSFDIDNDKIQEVLSSVKKLIAQKLDGYLFDNSLINDLACPNCKINYHELYKNSKFGCAKCYEYYSNIIKIMLNKCQKGNKHIGKIPSRFAVQEEKRQLEKELSLDVHDQIKSLQRKMQNAIKVENYEVAGVLKLKIEELQQKLPKF